MELVVDGSNYFETYEDLLRHSLLVRQTKEKTRGEYFRLSEVKVFVLRSSIIHINDQSITGVYENVLHYI